MTIYESKTGYVKRISSGEIFKGNEIYLGKYDIIEDYVDASESAYNNYQEELKSKMPL